MSDRDDIESGLSELLLAFERLGAVRRRELGLSMNEEAVLLFLAQGTSAPSDLSRAIGMTTAGMTNLLDRLESGGYLRREPDTSDKRRVLLTLTKKGFRSQLETYEANAELADLAASLSLADRQTILRFLREGHDLVDRRAVALEKRL